MALASSYIPELDSSSELDPDDLTFYQEMIGMPRWATELGRADIAWNIHTVPVPGLSSNWPYEPIASSIWLPQGKAQIIYLYGPSTTWSGL